MKNKFLTYLIIFSGFVFTATSAFAFLGLGSSPTFVAIYKLGAAIVASLGIVTDAGEQIVTDAAEPIIFTDALQKPDAPTLLEGTSQTNAVSLLWFEPESYDSPITDYAVEYKLVTAGAYTLFADGVSTDTVSSVSGLTAGVSYNFKVTAISNAGYGQSSNVVTQSPLSPIVGLDTVISNVVACWDGNVYSGSGNWLNQTPSPADGSAQAAYDITPSNTSLWSVNKWTMNNVANFALAGANTTLLNSLHKTTGGVDFTIMARIKTPVTPVTVDSFFGTADANLDYGIVLRADSGGAFKIDQYDGTSKVTKQATATLGVDSVYTLGVKYTTATGDLGFAVNSDTWQTTASTWTAGVSANATYTAKLASEGNNLNVMDNGAILYALCLINDDITDTQLIAVNDWFDGKFPVATPVAPGQVYSVVTMPTNGGLYLAWDTLPPDADHDKTGGSPITDYTIQYKLNSSGTWLTFTDGVSTNTYTTLTGITNLSLYDVRILATNAIGNGVYSATVSDTPQTEGTNPYDETLWKVTLPVNSTGLRQGSAIEIGSASIGTYSSAWFGRVGDIFRYNCVYPAATTATATYGRTELRGLTGGMEFNHNVDADKTLSSRVTDCPTSSGNTKVIVDQIHDADLPLIKINYDCRTGTGQDRLRALMKIGDGDTVDCDFNRDGVGETCPTIKSNITRGDWTKTRLAWDGDGSSHGGLQSLDLYVDDVLVGTYRYYMLGVNNPQYFKQGNYCQLGPAGSKVTVEHRAP